MFLATAFLIVFMPDSGLGFVGAGMDEILSSSVSICREISSAPFALFLIRTPGSPPFSAMNSTPAFSSAPRSAATVDCFASAPFSIRVTVLATTPAFSASSRTPKPSAARAARLATDAEAGATYAAAKAAVAKDQIERLAKGEDVKGGLGKPMTLKALLKAAGIAENQARHAERAHSLGDGLFEKFVQAGIEGMHRGEKSAERKFLRRHRPE